MGPEETGASVGGLAVGGSAATVADGCCAWSSAAVTSEEVGAGPDDAEAWMGLAS